MVEHNNKLMLLSQLVKITIYDYEPYFLDNLNWEEYHNPIEEQKETDFDSNLSSPTDWAHDWQEKHDW